MDLFRKPVATGAVPTISRSLLRGALRRAATGDTDAYLALIRPYFDLICEHLFLCNFDRTEILRQTEFLLREGWRRLPYLKRLSDWEHFLARSLVSIEVNAAHSREASRPQELVELERRRKFALIAFDLENWGYRWLSLALRISTKDLRKLLFETRCQLLGIDLGRCKRGARRYFSLISADLDGQLKPGQQRQALRRLCACEETKAFKSSWLDYRCRLIEVRQQIRLTEEERDTWLDPLGRDLNREDMLRPSLLARFRNLLSFQEVPARQVLPGRRDFSY